jgi:hypothetical protein
VALEERLLKQIERAGKMRQVINADPVIYEDNNALDRPVAAARNKSMPVTLLSPSVSSFFVMKNTPPATKNSTRKWPGARDCFIAQMRPIRLPTSVVVVRWPNDYLFGLVHGFIDNLSVCS